MTSSAERFSIYTAGAHRELQRCETWIAMLKELENVDVTLDWTGSIRAYGGDQQDDRSMEARAKTADDDMAAVLEARLIWLLLPRTITKGAWTELGGALMFNMLVPTFLGIASVKRANEMIPDNLLQEKMIIASWENALAEKSEDLPLFVSKADRIFDNDASAFGFIRGYVLDQS